MRTREYTFTAPDICDERDLRPKLIDMELQRLGRMYSPEASDQQRQDAARVKKQLLQVINKDKKGSK